MKEFQNYSSNYRGSSITKNTIYNLLGYGAPMLIAVLTIPILVKGLGTERFGVLSLAWIVIGYFSFFDFGIGKSLTKIIAEKIGRNQLNEIPDLFWTSLILMFGVSFFIVSLLTFFVPSIVNLINISEELKPEFIDTFYILVFSIPIVSTTAGLRGVLEAYQKFGMINIIRIFLGAFTFLVPMICCLFTTNIFWIVLILILLRIIVWVIYLNQCLNVNNDLKQKLVFKYIVIKPIIKFSFWITVTNIVGPVISNVDRFFIGALISVEAVAYYATPYEVITKLLLIPNALVLVLFPIFSASFSNTPDISKKLFYTGMKFTYIILYPIILIIVSFSYQGINLWLGPEFASQSTVILQILAIGILFNAISYIPFNFFQGVGMANIPAVLNLIELPFYLALMWISIKNLGIEGAAYVWLLRIIIDTVLIFFIYYKKFAFKFESSFEASAFLTSLICLVVPFFIETIYIKMFFSIGFLALFVIIVWKYFISSEEKKFIISKITWRVT